MTHADLSPELPEKVTDLLDRIVETKGRRDAVRQMGPYTWEARSPLREDSKHSMSIEYNVSEGRILLHDHAAENDTEAILDELGLDWRDLFVSDSPNDDRESESHPDLPKPAFISVAQQSRLRKAATQSRLKPWAKRWGVPIEVLERFDLGFDEDRDELIVFETNRRGQVISAVRRSSGEHDKRCIRGSSRGYVGVYELGAHHPGRLLITEGFTDLLALSSVGFTDAIARPSAGNAKQIDHLVMELGCREAVIFADQSQQEQACALRLAEELREIVPVRVVIPPEGIRDLREWINGKEAATLDEIEKAISATSHVYRPTQIPKAQPFPVDCLPKPVEQLCVHGAESMQVDPSMFAVPALVALAGAIGGTHIIEVKQGWNEPCILWAGVVSKSGSGKTPAQALAMRPLHEVDREMRDREQVNLTIHDQLLQEHKIESQVWEQQTKKAMAEDGELPEQPGPSPEPPQRERTVIQDITSEALGELMRDNPRGLIVDIDELTGWLGSFNAYRSGRGGDREMWLSIYGAKAIRVNRVGGREVAVDRPIVSVIGGIQPGVLRRSFVGENTDNGLAARFLLAAPANRISPLSDRSIPKSVVVSYESLVRRLCKYPYDGTPRVVRLSDDAWYHYKAWTNAPSDGMAIKLARADEGLSAALAKLKGYAARIALVLHLAEGHESNTPISSGTMLRALTITDWFVNEAERLYGSLFSGGDLENDDTQELLMWAWDKKGGWFQARDLKQGVRRYRSLKSNEISERLNRLVADGHGKWERRKGRMGVALG